MTNKPRLQRRLDEVASQLLDRAFPAAPQEGEQPTTQPEIEHQIRTFDAVVRYYGPRTKLGGKDEEKESEFGNLRDRLHGRKHNRKAARRRTSAEVEADELARLNGSNGSATGT